MWAVWPSGLSSHLEVPSKIVGLDMSMTVAGSVTNNTASQNRITIYRCSLKKRTRSCETKLLTTMNKGLS